MHSYLFSHGCDKTIGLEVSTESTYILFASCIPLLPDLERAVVSIFKILMSKSVLISCTKKIQTKLKEKAESYLTVVLISYHFPGSGKSRLHNADSHTSAILLGACLIHESGSGLSKLS